MDRQSAWAVVAGICLLVRAASGQWVAPADNLFTEEQLQVYIDTTRDWTSENARIADALAQATTDAERRAAVADLAQRHQACLDRHHISEGEYKWIARQATEAWSVVADIEIPDAKTSQDAANKETELRDRIRQARLRKAAYELALKNGRRVMTRVDRNEAVRSAQSEQRSALNEARLRDEEAAHAAAEADRHDTEAKAADDLASRPPRDISADNRADYIKQKTEEAQVDCDEAREARGRQVAAEMFGADAMERAAAAAQTAAYPDVPVTDEDKAAATAENKADIAQAQDEIDQCEADLQRCVEVESQLDKSADDLKKSAPPENVDLMRKHYDDFAQLFGAATQPSP